MILFQWSVCFGFWVVLGRSRGGLPVLLRLAFQRQGRFPPVVPFVLRALLHIFPTENGHFFWKTQFFALKRNGKRPCGLHTYIFLIFWVDEGIMKGRWRECWRLDEGSMKGSMKGRWRVHEGINDGSMKDRWRIDEGIDEGSMKDRWIKSKKQTKKENKKPKEETLY